MTRRDLARFDRHDDAQVNDWLRRFDVPGTAQTEVAAPAEKAGNGRRPSAAAPAELRRRVR